MIFDSVKMCLENYHLSFRLMMLMDPMVDD
jgi:hypothetical protein